MKVSVIIPVYNTEKYLPVCLNSLLEQTYTDFEIVCVNDGSTDGSPNILRSFAGTYPEKIRVITKPNGGVSSARNEGIRQSRGEYLIFVDSDDSVLPHYLQKLVSLAEKEDLDVVTCDFFYETADGRRIPASVSRSLSDEPGRDYLLSDPSDWGHLVRSSLLREDGFIENMLYEDLERMPRLILQSEKIGHVAEPLYNYLVHENSIMHAPVFSEKHLDIFRALESLYTHFEEAHQLKKYEKEIEYLYIEHLFRTAAMRFAEYENARELLKKIRDAVTGKFPHWSKNPYLKKRGLKFRLLVFLSSRKMIFCIRLLKKVKGDALS